MKLIFTTLFTIFLLQLKAQKDTSLRKYSIAICGCLEQQNIDSIKDSQAMEAVFLKCFMDSAMEVLTKISISEEEDNYEAGKEIGKKIGLDLYAMNCQAFIKMSVNVAGGNKGDKPEANTTAKTNTGEIIKVEEKEFIYLTLKVESGREYVLVYMQFVPGSDRWIKNPGQLKGKKVKASWKEYEVYFIKQKDFGNFKELKELIIL